MWLVVFLAAVAVCALGQECDPGSCKLPDCRCWDDKSAPGDLEVSETPQIVMVTIENSINAGDFDNYLELFNIVNPNGCAIRGTFFVEDKFTDYEIVNSLFDQGHEIGINTLDGTKPDDWVQMYKTIKDRLVQAGVNENQILGARAEGFDVGGDDQLIGMGDNGLRYDSSCARTGWSDKGTLVWPFTLDFKGPACDIGSIPSLPFPGYWEFPVADLHDLTPQRTPCLAPTACRNVTTKANAFDIFFNAFEDHYESNRAPMLVVIDPLWASNKEFRDGTAEFLDYIRAAYTDEVWIVPVSKALQWIQDPVPLANITSFAPWNCS